MITNIKVLYKDPSPSRWSTNKVMLTDDKGNRFEAHWTHADLNKERLKLSLLSSGADPDTLEKFQDACYNEGKLDECDANAGESM